MPRRLALRTGKDKSWTVEAATLLLLVLVPGLDGVRIRRREATVVTTTREQQLPQNRHEQELIVRLGGKRRCLRRQRVL